MIHWHSAVIFEPGRAIGQLQKKTPGRASCSPSSRCNAGSLPSAICLWFTARLHRTTAGADSASVLLKCVSSLVRKSRAPSGTAFAACWRHRRGPSSHTHATSAVHPSAVESDRTPHILKHTSLFRHTRSHPHPSAGSRQASQQRGAGEHSLQQHSCVPTTPRGRAHPLDC